MMHVVTTLRQQASNATRSIVMQQKRLGKETLQGSASQKRACSRSFLTSCQPRSHFPARPIWRMRMQLTPLHNLQSMRLQRQKTPPAVPDRKPEAPRAMHMHVVQAPSRPALAGPGSAQDMPVDAATTVARPAAPLDAEAPSCPPAAHDAHRAEHLHVGHVSKTPQLAGAGSAQGKLPIADGHPGAHSAATRAAAATTAPAQQHPAEIAGPDMEEHAFDKDTEAPDGQLNPASEAGPPHVQSQWEDSESQQPYCTLEGTQACSLLIAYVGPCQ